MRRVKFQEGGQARAEFPFETRRRMREEAAAADRAARGEAPRRSVPDWLSDYYRQLEEAQRNFRSNRGASPATPPAPSRAAPTPAPTIPRNPATASRPPASGANFPGETVTEAAPIADYEERMQRGALPAGRSATPGPMGQYGESAAAGNAARSRPAARPAPRRPAQREMSAEERQAFMERMMREEADREAAARRSERGFFERMGIRRTNETGLEPGTEARMRDMYGSQYSSQYNMKQGGKVKAYREGGAIRQGMQSPKAQEGRAEMAEDVMRRERAREPISDKERKAGRAEAAMDSGPLTGAEKERMRSSGFKKGGMIKPKGHGMKEEAMEMKGGRYRGGMKEEMAEMRSMSKMKKGGAVKKAAGGKVAAPKKMMKGGMTSKPKKMMGGGKVKYAKGGMTRGCK